MGDTPEAEAEGHRKFYESSIYPLLKPHQKVFLVPGCAASSNLSAPRPAALVRWSFVCASLGFFLSAGRLRRTTRRAPAAPRLRRRPCPPTALAAQAARPATRTRTATPPRGASAALSRSPPTGSTALRTSAASAPAAASTARASTAVSIAAQTPPSPGQDAELRCCGAQAAPTPPTPARASRTTTRPTTTATATRKATRPSAVRAMLCGRSCASHPQVVCCHQTAARSMAVTSTWRTRRAPSPAGPTKTLVSCAPPSPRQTAMPRDFSALASGGVRAVALGFPHDPGGDSLQGAPKPDLPTINDDHDTI